MIVIPGPSSANLLEKKYILIITKINFKKIYSKVLQFKSKYSGSLTAPQH
jgi:hypothetical protein